MNISRTRLLGFIILMIAIFLGFSIAKDRQAILAHHSESSNEFIVMGWSHNLLEGWYVSLAWRANRGPWRVYYLDHEASRWRNVSVNVKSNIVHVYRGDMEKSRLNVDTSELFLIKTSQTYMSPAFHVPNEDPFNRAQRVYQGQLPEAE